jgi:hypothetical protein
MKLYKFRPLATDGVDSDFSRLKDILKTGKFWCSKFSDLNDPLEGFYAFLNGSYVSKTARLIYDEKENYKICSFSDEEAFSNPAMWGYYANGFRGVAIEIEVCRNKVEPIKYKQNIPKLKNRPSDEEAKKEAKKILTTKLKPWEHENEYRFLEKSSSNEFKIGEITALYFGDPYGSAKNKEDIIENSKALKKYIELKDDILKISKDFELYLVKIKNCKVIKMRIPEKITETS